jgi:transposase
LTFYRIVFLLIIINITGDEIMLFAEVNPEAREELLQELKRSSDAKWYRRVKIIQLSSQQTSVPQLAKLFDLCTATVRDYIKRYNANGLIGLRRQSSDGAPAQIPLTKGEWEELLHQSPSQFDRLQTGARNWTQELVVEYLRAYYAVTVTQPAVSLCLKRHKISWNRGALKVTSPDPLYLVKRERIDSLKKKRPPTP